MPSAAARAVPEPVGYSRHQTMRLEAGSRLGPYEISGPLGAGGMGEVYRARDTRLGREVAIKVLPHDLSNDRDRLARFEREARSASALNHRNIVTIHDFTSQDGEAWLVMELIRGESLRDLIDRGPIPPKKILSIAIGIADGLAAAHAPGLVHRDLKPRRRSSISVWSKIRPLRRRRVRRQLRRYRAPASFSARRVTCRRSRRADTTLISTLISFPSA
ncbi:MAG: hypothetical protein DMF58_16910 [Acidobacteria bacterium]|nr:MAG: hypothetical protein DMF58_16910 [Acidobacteriota bacterium]